MPDRSHGPHRPAAGLPRLERGHLLGAALDADHLALDEHLAEGVGLHRVAVVFRAQFDVVAAVEEALDRGLLAAHQGDHDLAVGGELAWLADGQVALEDAGVAHGVALHAQKIGTLPNIPSREVILRDNGDIQ